MCGVIGLICERNRSDLGQISAELLRTLEYRGYDSTGAAIQGEGIDVDLRKGVGAPSAMVHSLGIVDMAGRIFCGQVRWATFGAVDDANAQPHVVRCHTYIYGAHNGNVTNCDALKAWLLAEGHAPASDNDGEMVVHTVEHFFARELALLDAPVREDRERRRAAMRSALLEAVTRIEGSFAAVIVDPISQMLWSMKLGSSLYFGLGSDETGGHFGIASSDLSSILKLTRRVVPIAEGEVVEYDAKGFEVLAVRDHVARLPSGPRRFLPGQSIPREPVRSRLRVEDTVLRPPFETFMEQEIASQSETIARLLTPRDEDREEVAELRAALTRFADAAAEAANRGRELRIVCWGSSYNAAKAACRFFDVVAHTPLTAWLPGEFRSQCEGSLRDGDVVIAVSQSGETKDLVDALDDVVTSGKRVLRVSLVNNVRSTIPQEKSDLVIPLSCGAEVAVPATKSFMSQLAVLFMMALEVGGRRAFDLYGDGERAGAFRAELTRRREAFARLPALLDATLETTRAPVEEAAELLHLAPSLHVLGTGLVGIAREGALKVREVVLNHAEGFDASEFKHGPNTILGFSTVWGGGHVRAMLDTLADALATVAWQAAEGGSAAGDLSRIVRDATRSVLREDAGADGFDAAAVRASLKGDYPLLYVTGPEDRDVALTISALHTHKIRGSSTVVIAEENSALRVAATKAPADNAAYRWVYLALPRGDDPLLVAFTSTLVLQRLALRMSLRKKAWLDATGFIDHGVHPDTPKNVSKSITVD